MISLILWLVIWTAAMVFCLWEVWKMACLVTYDPCEDEDKP